MMRKLVIGSGCLALVPLVRAANPIEDKTPTKPPLMRPSDLPIYEAPHAEYREYIEETKKSERSGYLRSVIREPVKVVRQQFQGVWEQSSSIKHTVQDNYQEFQDRTDWIVKYLREEENKDMRYGAVAMGGLTGFIFGLRGGIFRKLFYTGIGTTAMGFVCFPDETRDLAKKNGAFAKQYINIAYNFLYGVKPGDPQLEVKLPELSFPKDLSELVDLSVSVASTIKQAVMPPPAPAKEEEKPEKKSEKKE